MTDIRIISLTIKALNYKHQQRFFVTPNDMEMDATENDYSNGLLKSCGNVFFDKLEEHIETDIPIILRNIPLINDIDRAVLLS